VAKIDGPFSWEDDIEGYEKYTKTQTVKELQLVEEYMTKIHLQDAMLQLQMLQDKLDAAERLNKPPTKLIAIPEVLRQAGWMPIPKPLTDDEIELLTRETDTNSWICIEVARIIERRHGIGEKE